MINKSNIGELTVEQKDFRITIKQKEEKQNQVAGPPVQVIPYPNVPPHVPAHMSTPPPAAGKPAPPAEVPEDVSSNNYITIKSPMIGTFYRRPAPDKPNFVETGTEINPGKVVCIIEAMKLFNEIESEVKGRIVRILVEDATPVEYDQPLFLVEPI